MTIPNDIGAVVLTADAHLENGNVHLFAQEHVERHDCEELEVGWHVQFMFLANTYNCSEKLKTYNLLRSVHATLKFCMHLLTSSNMYEASLALITKHPRLCLFNYL